jgi:hypothetical protein
MPPHILAVFNQLYEELKSMKQQQWTITNYGALDPCRHLWGSGEAAPFRGVPLSIETSILGVQTGHGEPGSWCWRRGMHGRGAPEAIPIPKTETAVIRQFQERMPYGLFVPDVQP